MMSENRSRQCRSIDLEMFVRLPWLSSNRRGSSSMHGIPREGWEATAMPTRFLWMFSARTVLSEAFFQSRIEATLEGLLSFLKSWGCIVESSESCEIIVAGVGREWILVADCTSLPVKYRALLLKTVVYRSPLQFVVHWTIGPSQSPVPNGDTTCLCVTFDLTIRVP